MEYASIREFPASTAFRTGAIRLRKSPGSISSPSVSASCRRTPVLSHYSHASNVK
jgi:hypothetical protein